MKKITLLFVSLSCYFVNAQNDNSNMERKKIQLGLNYALTSEDISFKNPFTVSINYQVKQWEAIDLGIGVQTFIFSPKSQYNRNYSTRWGFNPNVNSSYSFLDNKLRIYLAFGYYFDKYTLTTDELPTYTPSRDYALKSSGFTFAPGIKYFLHSNIFFDVNYTFLNVKTKDDQGFSQPNNNNLFNIGLGASF